MTIHPTDDEITSSVTPHTATRCPGGWAVTWLGDRTVDRNRAVTAMLLAEEAVTASRGNPLSDETLKSCRLIEDLAAELGLTGEQAIDMVRETLPPAEVHDTHAIPAQNKPKPAAAEINPGDLFADADDDEWVAVSTGHETCLVNPAQLYATKQVVEKWGPLVKYLSDDEPISTVEPAKTHDLSIRRTRNGNVSIAVEGERAAQVYLLDGVALDLGRVLEALAPAQLQLLVDDLTGGEK